MRASSHDHAVTPPREDVLRLASQACLRSAHAGLRAWKPSARASWTLLCAILPSTAITRRASRIFPRNWASPKVRFSNISAARADCSSKPTKKPCVLFPRTWIARRRSAKRDFLKSLRYWLLRTERLVREDWIPYRVALLGNYGVDLALKREINRFLLAEDPYGSTAFVRLGIARGEVRSDIDPAADRFDSGLDDGTVSGCAADRGARSRTFSASRGSGKESGAHQSVFAGAARRDRRLKRSTRFFRVRLRRLVRRELHGTNAEGNSRFV